MPRSAPSARSRAPVTLKWTRPSAITPTFATSPGTPGRICPPRALDQWLTHNSVRGEAGPVFLAPNIAEKAPGYPPHAYSLPHPSPSRPPIDHVHGPLYGPDAEPVQK